MAATKQQVKVFMDQRDKGQNQAAAAAKAGISERTGRRIEREGTGRGRKPRDWRTRSGDLGTWGQVVKRAKEPAGILGTHQPSRVTRQNTPLAIFRPSRFHLTGLQQPRALLFSGFGCLLESP